MSNAPHLRLLVHGQDKGVLRGFMYRGRRRGPWRMNSGSVLSFYVSTWGLRPKARVLVGDDRGDAGYGHDGERGCKPDESVGHRSSSWSATTSG
jgi:hypothetical protein